MNFIIKSVIKSVAAILRMPVNFVYFGMLSESRNI